MIQPQNLETPRNKSTCYSELSPKLIHDKTGKTDMFEIKPQQIEIEEKVIEESKKVDSKKILGPKKNNNVELNQLAGNDCLSENISDQARLKTIKKTEISSTLERPGRFLLIVIWLCLANFSLGFNQGFIGSFVVTIANKNNFGWEKGSEEYTQNVSLLSSLFFLGMAFATCTQTLFLKMNQMKLLLLLQVCTILISGISCIDNLIVLVICRVLIGYISGLLRPTA